MSKIRLLPPDLADKIAAGEVVERPASVVKELVENALDAGARSIRVVIDEGGRKRIQVSDDGCGMTPEEAKLSIQRHATSKIKTEEDLHCITTLGFRGEALPSIAAVSHLLMETKPQKELEGTFLKVVGGKLVETHVAGVPEGTKISVENLFFNTPARLKFLKSDGVERGHIDGTVLHLALSHPHVAFDYFVDGKQKLSSPISKDLLVRLQVCLGKPFVEDALPMEERNPELKISGWVLHPRQTSGNANHLYTFLNGRFLRDRVLQHAILQGFGDFLVKGQYPKAVLYLEMDPGEVDVNVHPSKREVRFRKPQMIHQFVVKAIKKVLQGEIYGRGEENIHSLEEMGGEMNSKRRPSVWGGPQTGDSPLGAANDHDPQSVGGASERLFSFISPPISSKPSAISSSVSKICFRELRVIGTLADTYILCEASENKLVLIDQHAAHEWIGFRKLKKNFEEPVGKSQQLLIPLTWEATPEQSALLKAHLETLHQAGLEMEPFGGDTFVVKAVPTLVAEKKIPSLLEKICDELATVESSSALEKTIDHVLITMACHAQVRAHDKLSPEEIRHLLVEMDEYQALHCPHGRPTFVEITKKEVERWFKRV